MLNYGEPAEFNYVELIYYKVGQVLHSGKIYYKAGQWIALYFKKWLFIFQIDIDIYKYINIYIYIYKHTYTYMYVNTCGKNNHKNKLMIFIT